MPRIAKDKDAIKEAAAPSISAQAQQDAISEGIEEFELPKSLVTRIAKSALPENAKMSKDVSLSIVKASTVFINYLAASAHDVAAQKQHKSISASDVLKALELLELGDMVDPLQKELQIYREHQKSDRSRKGGASAKGKGRETEGSSVSASKSKASTSAKGKEKEKAPTITIAPRVQPSAPAVPASDHREDGVEEADARRGDDEEELEGEPDEETDDVEEDEVDEMDEEDEAEEEELEDRMAVEDEETVRDARGLEDVGEGDD